MVNELKFVIVLIGPVGTSTGTVSTTSSFSLEKFHCGVSSYALPNASRNFEIITMKFVILCKFLSQVGEWHIISGNHDVRKLEIWENLTFFL